MKKYNTIRLAFILIFFIPVALPAQFTNGSLVGIKNYASQKFVIAKAYVPDSAVFIAPMTNSNVNFGLWRIIIGNGGYCMLQTKEGNNYLGIKSDTGAANNNIIQRRLTETNRDELTWLLVRAAGGYQLRNKKNNRFLTELLSGSRPFRNLINTVNVTPASMWVINPISTSPATADTSKKVLYDVMLNYIGVSEATRNRIDNGDCRRVFGEIRTEVWELDNNNQKKRRLTSYDNMPEFIYKQYNILGPPTEALSYYQDNLNQADKNVVAKVTYNIPEALLNNRKILLVVKAHLGSRHKDSDFSSFDALRMKEEKTFTFILDNRNERKETLQAITERIITDLVFSGQTFGGNLFYNGDDTHKFWMNITCKKL